MAALARLAATTKELAGLQAELDAFGACDPVKVEEKRRAAVLAREAALRHTGLGVHFPTPHIGVVSNLTWEADENRCR